MRSIHSNGLRWLAALGAIAYLIVRKRKWLYAAGAAWVWWRVYFMVAAIAIALYAVMIPQSAYAQYPGGVRDVDQWYYCYASATDFGTLEQSDWGPMTCEHMLWQSLGGDGGEQTSVLFEGAVAANATPGGNSNVVRAWIVPPQGIKSYVFKCTATAGGTRTGSTGTRNAQVLTDNAGSWASTADMAINGPALAVGESLGTTIDVVSDQYAITYDVFYSQAPASSNVGTWSAWGQYSYFQAIASVSNANSSTYAGFSCRILSWQSWPAWLATNPEWAPDAGDMVPSPTPTPGPGWGSLPWDVITDSVNMPEMGITEPISTTCGTVIPGYEWSWSGEEYGWDEIEFCYEERDVNINFMGFDVGGYLLVAMLLGGVGVLASIIKRS